MKKVGTFFLKLAAFAVVLIIVDFVGGMALKQLFYKQKSGKYFTTTHALFNANENIAIIGNSHAAEHYNAPMIKKRLNQSVFNFGNQSQTLLYFYPLVKSILDHHKPKLIVVEVDYNELQYIQADYQKLSIFTPYLHHSAIIDSSITMVGDNENYKALSSLYRFNSTLGYLLLNTFNHDYNKSMKSLGYDPVYGNLCSNVPTKQTTTEGTVKQDTVIDQNKVNTLIKLINYVRAHNVKLLVTTTPLYNYNPAKADKLRTKLKQILEQEHVDYLDDACNSNFQRKCELFHDTFHLNSKGADIYTNHFIDYIVKNKLVN